MKLQSGRSVFVASLLLTFLASAWIPSRAFTSQQEKEKPKLQKPEIKPDNKSQKKPDADQDEDVPILRGTLVMLDVTVVDSSSKPVLDLNQDNFAVTEDKVPQKIEVFRKDNVPVSLVFAIDTSGSMRPKLDTVVKASSNLVKESRRGDEVAVIEFKEEATLLEEFTSDIPDVIDTLNGLVASRGTAMLDALYVAADYAGKEGKNQRKAVLVITDGLDKDSVYKMSEVVEHLREIEVQVYLIGFISDLEKDTGLFKRSPQKQAETLLSKLAEETGGRAFFPKELSEVHAIADQISTDLRSQYSIGYYPTNNKRDGTYRTVKVQISAGNRRLVARTRNGYIATPRGVESTKTR